jgi:hypothetical protein
MLAFLVVLGAYLQLYNDSSTYLFVRIFGADGTLLSETSLAPQATNIYSDQYSSPTTNPSKSQTPYTVHWYCQDSGVDYSICTDVSDGALVSASSCPGSRQCPVKKTPKSDQMPENFGEGFKYPPTFPPQEND